MAYDGVIDDVKKAIALGEPSRVPVFALSGNMDPIEVLMRATPEEVAAETERIMAVCKPGGGYVFCTGEMNPRDTPVENMRTMIQAAKRLA